MSSRWNDPIRYGRLPSARSVPWDIRRLRSSFSPLAANAELMWTGYANQRRVR
jgi:hypothetical protein